MKAVKPVNPKKDHILQATVRLLTQKGLQSLSFEGVANEAGLSRQLVRYHFSDVDTLMIELWDHMALSYQDTLVSGVVQVGQVERLGFFLDFFFGVSEDHPMPANIEAYDAMFAYSVGCDALKDRMRAQYRALGQVILHELAIAHPGLSQQDCEEVSFLFVSAMHAHWSFVATLGYAREHGLLARQAFANIVSSYVQKSKSEPLVDEVWKLET